MNKYLIPLIITTGIGIYYFYKKNNEIIELEEIIEEQVIDNTEHVENKDRYRIVVYKPEGWELVD